jgi:flavin reductase (DIM6/NTAB) family NADH-FMN oxidoreductase RutF
MSINHNDHKGCTRGEWTLNVNRSASMDHGDPPSTIAVRAAFAAMPAGVAVITTVTPTGPWGVTASSVTALSLEPALILACLSRSSRTLRYVFECRRFAVNILRATDQHTADEFARPQRDHASQRASISHTVDGLPIVASALAWLTCGLTDSYPGGDHEIVIGAIRDTWHSKGEPLVRHRSGYRRLA